MSLWHRESAFLQECLEVLFRCLLAMKAHDVPRRRVFAREFVGHFPVPFGLVNPLGSLALHKGPFLSRLSHAETNHRPSSRARFARECARSGRVKTDARKPG